MEGLVLHYEVKKKQGLISSNDGNRYEFSADQWKSNSIPKTGASVDFIADNNNALQIFELKSKETPKFDDKINALFSKKIYNKLGVFASIALIIAIFLPTYKSPSFFIGNIIIFDTWIGRAVFVFLIVVIIYYYGGATRIYTQILSCIALILMFFINYELIGLKNVFVNFSGFFQTLKACHWGAYINICACIALMIATFKKGYNKNKNAI